MSSNTFGRYLSIHVKELIGCIMVLEGRTSVRKREVYDLANHINYQMKQQEINGQSFCSEEYIKEFEREYADQFETGVDYIGLKKGYGLEWVIEHITSHMSLDALKLCGFFEENTTGINCKNSNEPTNQDEYIIPIEYMVAAIMMLENSKHIRLRQVKELADHINHGMQGEYKNALALYDKFYLKEFERAYNHQFEIGIDYVGLKKGYDINWLKENIISEMTIDELRICCLKKPKHMTEQELKACGLLDNKDSDNQTGL